MLWEQNKIHTTHKPTTNKHKKCKKTKHTTHKPATNNKNKKKSEWKDYCDFLCFVPHSFSRSFFIWRIVPTFIHSTLCSHFPLFLYSKNRATINRKVSQKEWTKLSKKTRCWNKNSSQPLTESIIWNVKVTKGKQRRKQKCKN